LEHAIREHDGGPVTAAERLSPLGLGALAQFPDANELVADIHDRMPAILAPGDYARWLSDEPDPRELMRRFPAD